MDILRVDRLVRGSYIGLRWKFGADYGETIQHFFPR